MTIAAEQFITIGVLLNVVVTVNLAPTYSIQAGGFDVRELKIVAASRLLASSAFVAALLAQIRHQPRSPLFAFPRRRRLSLDDLLIPFLIAEVACVDSGCHRGHRFSLIAR
jgi:hypothetical protein